MALTERPGTRAPLWTGALGVAVAALIAGLLTAGVVARLGPDASTSSIAAPGVPEHAALVTPAAAGAAGAAAAVAATGAAGAAGAVAGRAALERHLRETPDDWPAWSALGTLELERGRATQDPAAYAAAERGFTRSLAIQPRGNADGRAGLAALAAARHDFASAQRQARAALREVPRSPAALTVLVDALTELGRYDEALRVARRLDAVQPGLASFARLSYQAELRGDLTRARELMARAARDAARDAGTPAQVGFTRYHLGLLALESGDPVAAAREWRVGTELRPDDPDLHLLGARIAWAQGDRDLALRRYAQAVARRPAPALITAQAEALAAAGRPGEARRALDLARAARALAIGSGVAGDASDVLFEADHGDPAAAVRSAERLWRRAPSVTSADAYGWALHTAGDDRAALAMADRALRLGGRSALMLAHRGLIRAALSEAGAAERVSDAANDLRAALRGAAVLPPGLADRVRSALAEQRSSR